MTVLTAELIERLASEEGAALLAEAESLPEDRLRRLSVLRRSHGPQECAAAVALLDLRKRAASKFALAHRMFFTEEGLEQSTSDEVGAWRAARFPADARILDLCCGIGGDALALAGRAYVTAIDIAPEAAACARANAASLGLSDRLSARVGDVTEWPLEADAAFIDPSRRRDGKRVRAAEQYLPPLSFVRTVVQAIPNLAVKVSPAIDDAAIRELAPRVEFVSHRGECKECVLWFGGIGPAAERTASVLPAAVTLCATEPDGATPPLGPLRSWLIEPDPAAIRAHLLPEICRMLDATAISPAVAYLTADAPTHTPLATAYRIVDVLPMSLHALQRRLKALDRRAVAVKKRGLPHDAEDIGRRLPPRGSAPTVVVLTPVASRPTAILCEPAGSGAAQGE